MQSIEVFLFGVGTIGSQLLEQIRIRAEELIAQNIDIKVCGIANSKQMILSKEGINLNNWQHELENFSITLEPQKFFEQVHTEKFHNAVLVDCTTSENIAQNYPEAFKARMHVVTANKKANTSNFIFYEELRNTANEHHRRFLYETNVGAGLPIIDTLQNLIKSGDKLIHFSGILSGSLSFIFGLLEEGIPFSQAVTIALNNKLTEPDPREDLSGLDVARKLLILQREAKGQLELNAIEVVPLFPKNFDLGGNVQDFLLKLQSLDSYFANEVMRLKKENKVLRYIGEISENKCRVGILEVAADHPMQPIKGGENAFAFLTERYSPMPLVIRGYGAGKEVTAAGVLADVLRTIYWH